MEHRDDGLLVDFSGTELKDTGRRQGNHAVVYNEKQERELATLSQETRLMKAMNEIREYAPKNMTADQRDKFSILCDNIFKKHGITPEVYREQFGHLGTTDQLHK